MRIEPALMKLYHNTGDDRYEKLANWYLNKEENIFILTATWFTPVTGRMNFP
jgi:hypothetical protein